MPNLLRPDSRRLRNRRSDVAPVLLHLHQLTPRERQVTRLMLMGLSTEDAAAELWVTTETLRGHVKSVFTKLGVENRVQLAISVHDAGLV